MKAKVGPKQKVNPKHREGKTKRKMEKVLQIRKHKKELKAKKRITKERKEAEILSVPRSIIVARGISIPKPLRSIVMDLRKLMLPYTAFNFEVNPSQSWKIIKEACQSMVVTHAVSVKASVGGTKLNIARLPHGPTLQFKVTSYTLREDLKEFFEQQGASFSTDFATQHPPLVVLNNFVQTGDEKTAATVKLMAVTLQNMFPPVDVNKFNLKQTKRVVMFNYDPEEDVVHMRHYRININSKSNSDDNEGEEGSAPTKKEKVSLVELGPRLTMQLKMVRDGAMDGDLIYVRDSKLTPKEIEVVRERNAQKKALRDQRRKEQEKNVQSKKEQFDSKKKKSTKQDKEEELKQAWEDKLAKAGTELEDDDDDVTGRQYPDSDEDMDAQDSDNEDFDEEIDEDN
jgi:ribosome biogenesis protein SSF1/2